MGVAISALVSVGTSAAQSPSVPATPAVDEPLCKPGGSELSDIQVVLQADGVAYPGFPEPALLTAGVFLNAHAELFVIQIVRSNALVEAEPTRACLDLVPDQFDGKIPEGDDARFGVDPEEIDLDVPASSRERRSRRGSEESDAPGETGDRYIVFRPMGYFGNPFDPASDREDQYQSALRVLEPVLAGTPVGAWDEVHGEFAIDDWYLRLSDLPGELQFTPLAPASLPDGLPADHDYEVMYEFDPKIGAGAEDGWGKCAFSSWGSVTADPSDGVRSALYDKGTVEDDTKPYSWNASSLRCYLIRVQGKKDSTSYQVHGSSWYWIY